MNVYLCCCQSIEVDMVEQVQRFEGLNECGQQIVQYVDHPATVEKINKQLEEFHERWERLVQQMELQSNQVWKNTMINHVHCNMVLFRLFIFCNKEIY